MGNVLTGDDAVFGVATAGNCDKLIVRPSELDGQQFPHEFVACNSCGKKMDLAHFFNCKSCTDQKINCAVSYELCGPCIHLHTKGHLVLQYKDGKVYGKVDPCCVGAVPTAEKLAREVGMSPRTDRISKAILPTSGDLQATDSRNYQPQTAPMTAAPPTVTVATLPLPPPPPAQHTPQTPHLPLQPPHILPPALQTAPVQLAPAMQTMPMQQPPMQPLRQPSAQPVPQPVVRMAPAVVPKSQVAQVRTVLQTATPPQPRVIPGVFRRTARSASPASLLQVTDGRFSGRRSYLTFGQKVMRDPARASSPDWSPVPRFATNKTVATEVAVGSGSHANLAAGSTSPMAPAPAVFFPPTRAWSNVAVQSPSARSQAMSFFDEKSPMSQGFYYNSDAGFSNRSPKSEVFTSRTSLSQAY